MSWLRRWDERNAKWARQTNEEWARVPKVDGRPIEAPDRVMDAYVRYHFGKIVVLGVGSLVAVVVALIQFPPYLIGAGLALLAAAAVLFVVNRYRHE